MLQKNRLLNFKDKIIYQDDDWFMFSLDSVLLVNFVTIRLNDKKIIDFCSGNAPIPMLLTYKTKSSIIGIELQKPGYELGVRSITENDMASQIQLINDDVKNVKELFCEDSFDLILCNPPYFKNNDKKLIADTPIKSIARHEICLTLDDVLKCAKYLLKNGGTLSMVHRPERLIEIIDKMHFYGFEPKKVQFVYPKIGMEANTLLIEGVKGGKSGLKILPPLIVHEEDGSYTEKIRSYFQE